MTENAPVVHSENSDNTEPVDSQGAMFHGHDSMLNYEQRIQFLETEVRALREILVMITDAQEEEKAAFRTRMAEFDGLHHKIREAINSSAESNRLIHNFGKRVDGVKRYATSGVVASFLVFSTMLVISLLMR